MQRKNVDFPDSLRTHEREGNMLPPAQVIIPGCILQALQSMGPERNSFEPTATHPFPTWPAKPMGGSLRCLALRISFLS